MRPTTTSRPREHPSFPARPPRDALPPWSRIAPSPGVVAAPESDGRLVLVCMATGLRLTLDDFGARVWALLAAEPTLPRLVLQLRGDGGRADLLAEDLARLLARWVDAGAVVWR